MAKLTIFLFTLLLLGCNEEAQAKPPEQPLEPPRLVCVPFCDDEKIKDWYQKKYGEPITEFEISVKSIFYEYANSTFNNILVTRTATGAIAYGIELSMEEWLEFIRTLSKLRIYEWEKEYKEYRGDEPINSIGYTLRTMNARRWTVEIISSDTLKSIGWSYAYPENFYHFEKTMKDIGKKIKENKRKEAEAKLSTQYQKRFGKSITDFELSITSVSFTLKPEVSNKEYEFKVSIDEETNTQALLLTEGYAKKKSLKLSIEDWLDFIHALHKTHFYEWKKEDYEKKTYDYFKWELYIVYWNKNVLYKGTNTYLPNWAEFKKAMDDMAAKIKDRVGK